MEISGVKALIFDMGGTLYQVPCDLYDMMRMFLTEVGLSELSQIATPDLQKAMNEADDWLDTLRVNENVDSHWLPSTDVWVEYDRRLLALLGVDVDLDRLAKEFQAKWDNLPVELRSKLLDGVPQTLKELQSRGYRLGIASNRYDDPTRRLKSDGLAPLFDDIEYTSVPGYRKPSPYMLIQVAATMGINPRKCAYVGNSVKFDVEAATRAEMIPILITWCNPEEVENVVSDTIIIEDIKDLLELFQ
jgi:HAD superfamily hydrolase (TIGR01549 family)